MLQTISSRLSCFFSELQKRLTALSAWQRALVAIIVGAVAVLAMPPFGWFPVLWLCFPLLVLLAQQAKNRVQAFVIGWSFAFGFLTCGLYWIAAAMFVDIGKFWWAVPLAVCGLPAFFALYYGLTLAVARSFDLRGLRGALIIALAWFAGDEMRGHFLTGFPWNLEGYAWDRVLPMLQSTAWVGIYGLTLITAATACLPAILSENTQRNRIIVGFSFILLLLLGCAGALRLHDAPSIAAEATSTKLRLVQPNIDQAKKWQASGLEDHFQKLLALSALPSGTPPDAIIWPETASTSYLYEDRRPRLTMTTAMPDKAVLITGVIRRVADDQKGILHYFNSLTAIDKNADIIATYDKNHLVPFGEYIPFRHWLPLSTLANAGLDFDNGQGLRTLHIQALPSFSPLICYEVIFPGEVTGKSERPDFLLNITNDGWYGHTTGPFQHFASARVRAIEEGLPLARAANTGISAMIDPYGRIVSTLGLEETGIVDAQLPRPLAPTFYARNGDLALTIVIICFFGFIWWETKNE